MQSVLKRFRGQPVCNPLVESVGASSRLGALQAPSVWQVPHIPMGLAKTGQSATWDSLGDELVSLILQKVSSSPFTDALHTTKLRRGSMEPSLISLAQLSAVDKRMWRLCRDPNLYRYVPPCSPFPC